MHRRLVIIAIASWPALRALAQDEGGRPRHKISAAALHEGMSARFPVRLRVGGLLELRISAPQLLLLPARNRIGASLVAEVTGTGLPLLPVEPGELDLVFALRYEPTDQTIRAHRLEILDFRWRGLPPQTAQTLRRVLPAVARDAVGEFVLHRFSPRELALPDTMGFEPEKLTVVDDGLIVAFGPKQSR